MNLHNPKAKSLIVIGAGLSGTLLTLQILKQASAIDEVTLTLIDRNSEKDLGPAYSSEDECLLLNVPAGKMGAFANDPAHFLKWAGSKGIEPGEWDFLP